MKKLLIAAMCAAVFTCGAEETQLVDEALPPAEGWSPIGFAILPVQYLQFPGDGSDVNGLRIALTSGHNREVNGLDFAAVWGWADGEINGLSCSGLGRISGGAAFGVHLTSAVNYSSGWVTGAQLATVNSSYGISGMQVGLTNFASEGNGIQLGLFNMAETFRGVQLGLVNIAMDYSGVQIGLGNIIGESPLTACMFFNAWF